MPDTLKSLNLVYTFPYPPRSGYDLRVWHLTRNLGRQIEQTLLCRHDEPLREAHREAVKQARIDLHSLYLKKPNLAQKCAKSLLFLLKAQPVMAGGWYFWEMRKRLLQLVRAKSFDFIVMEGIWLSSYWPIIQQTRALKVLNHYDLETVRLSRLGETQGNRLWRWFLQSEARRMSRLERRILDSCDLVWVTSETDRKGLEALNPAWPVHVAPNGVDARAIRRLAPVSGSREILFVGAYDNYPNEDAVLHFAESVFPRIRERIPDAVFRVVGRHPTPDVLALKRVPGIRVEGAVDSVRPFYERSALLVVPLRSGGGTRLKILEGMAYGRPVVSTRIGAEGLDLQNGRDVILADEPAELAEAVIRMIEHPQAGAELAGRARLLVESRYDWSIIAGRMLERYLALAETKRRAGLPAGPKGKGN